MGAVQILTHSMVQSIEENSVRKGYDPRDFALVAEGGAGPLFAAQIALEAGTPWVVVPNYPGVTAALGLLATDMVYEYVSTVYERLSKLDAEALQRAFEELEGQARAQLEHDGIPADQLLIQRVADCRYLGQGYELRVDVGSGAIDEAWVEEDPGGLPRHPRARVLAPVRGLGHRDPERPRARHRADAAARGARGRGGRRRRTLRSRYERDAWFRVGGELEAGVDALLRPGGAEGRQPARGPGDRQPVRLDDRDPAGADRADRPLREHRHRHRTSSAEARAPRRCRLPTEVGAMSVTEYEVGRRPGPPTRKRVEVDPITLRVLGGAFHAIAKEMAGVLFRMSYSSIIRESEDLGAGIFDAEGRELCESDSTPMHIGSLPWYIRGFLHRLDGEIEDGDVIVHNHPYLGASHSPDVAVAVPIFHEGELLGYAAVTAHVLDVGGSFPGINADAFDVYAEAKMYNALRWYERGELNEDLDRMIFDNVRTETMNRGDMNAMLAACQLGQASGSSASSSATAPRS